MSGWFNNPHRPSLEELPDVLRELVNEVRQEKGELESLLARVSTANHQAASHAEGLAQLSEREQELSGRIGTAEGRIDRLKEIGDRVDEIAQRAEDVERGQEASQSGAAALKEELAGVESSVREIRDIQKQAGELRVNLDALTGEKGSVNELENRAESIRATVEELVASVANADDRQGELTKVQDDTMARVADMKDSAGELGRSFRVLRIDLPSFKAHSANSRRWKKSPHVPSSSFSLSTPSVTTSPKSSTHSRSSGKWSIERRLKQPDSTISFGTSTAG